MAIFDWVYAGSGQPIKYGGATVFTENNTRTYYRQGLTTYIQPSGSSAYFNVLNNRYINEPSGWNA